MVKKSNKSKTRRKAGRSVSKNGLRIGRPPKFNYDRDDFYDAIASLAMQGFTNRGIAWRLADTFGESLTPQVFSQMVQGTYENWTDEENERRSKRITECLASARDNVNCIVRGRFLKAALGGIKLHNKNVTKRKLLIDGSPEEVVQTTETETETPPNIQALSTWLYHHDPEWRKVQKGLEPEEEIGKNIESGIDTESWIEKEIGLIGDTADT